ncbi:histidine kinase [Coleofasciculus sp. E1-EBD-02]|uniref:histidine kinase n=1 Tax=Coleofasciculus sp. E1-EBD-02 TaxID=3068481 RepID=UPI0032FCCE7C
MQVAHENSPDGEATLQLLLFVDERPSSRKPIHHIRNYLESLKQDYPFELMIVKVGEQPYLAEHFKIVATPALLKIHPQPRQTLAGTNLVGQLKSCWSRWQRCLEDYKAELTQQMVSSANGDISSENGSSAKPSMASSVEVIQLTDEIFRLNQENTALRENIHFKDQILSMLAHDIRNPLTAASIAIDTLELGQNNPSQSPRSELTPTLKARLLEQARIQLRTIDRMITEILQAAKGSNADFYVKPRKLALGPLCQDILNQMQESFQLKSQIVETDIPQDLPPVHADSELVRQVIVNLLDNANKYTPKGGKIQVSMLHRTTQKVQVSVYDTGPGIPEENRDRIFENHFRLKRDQGKDGYGIGLSLCQRIIRAHYGRIWVDCPTKGKGGGCFHFTLPIYR